MASSWGGIKIKDISKGKPNGKKDGDLNNCYKCNYAKP